jgi:hypothetical protein
MCIWEKAVQMPVVMGFRVCLAVPGGKQHCVKPALSKNAQTQIPNHAVHNKKKGCPARIILKMGIFKGSKIHQCKAEQIF